MFNLVHKCHIMEAIKLYSLDVEKQQFHLHLSPLQSQQLLQKLKTLASIKTSVRVLLMSCHE